MDKSQEQISNEEEGKNESNKGDSIGEESNNKEPAKTNLENANLPKKDSSQKKTSSNLSNQEKQNEILNKMKSNSSDTSKSKNSVDNFIDNKDRYKEVIKCINEFEDKLKNTASDNGEIPVLISQDNEEEQNNDINELKNQLLNVKRDEDNLINFNQKIEELLPPRKPEPNDETFEKTVSDLFYRKYNLTKFNAFKFINLVKSKEDSDFTAQIDYFRIMIEDLKGNKDYCFFKDRDYFPIYYENILLLFEKDSQGIPNKVSIFSHNFKYLTQFRIEKYGQNYIFPIYKVQLSEEFVELETKKE